MARKAVFLLALIAALGQALVPAAFPPGLAGDMEHLLVHLEQHAHGHEHEDLGLQAIGSEKGFHVHPVDGVYGVLPSAPVLPVATRLSPGPLGDDSLRLPSPVLDGLLRPPRSSA